MTSAALALDATPPRKRRPAALGFIYAVILMNTMAVGVIFPVFPPLVKMLSGQGDAGGAQIMGVFAAAWSVMNLLSAPIFGNLSDRFGRRPVLLVSMFGLALDYVIMALAPSIGVLFIGRVISGITASSGGAAAAYVIDISGEDDRARNIGRFQAAANAGILIGPALGGFGLVAAEHIGIHDPRAPFWLAAGLALANGVFGLFAVPESLAPERRAPFDWRRANPIGAVVLLFSRPGLLGMALVFFFIQFANQSFNSLFQFYTHYRFGWGPPNVALLLMVLSGGGIITSSFVAGPAAKRLGERGAVLVGLGLFVIAMTIDALAPTVPLFWLGIAVGVAAGFGFPSLFSLLTKRVGVDQQGQLQGAMQIVFGLTGLLGPITFTSLFAWAVGPGRGLGLPGLPLLVGAAITFAGWLMAVVYARPRPDDATPDPEARREPFIGH
ncbi:MAG TPA: MFS transporter [Caulobacteraceae bacterium]|nr:MFS transporter [Caulobacteraceae bacterium]